MNTLANTHMRVIADNYDDLAKMTERGGMPATAAWFKEQATMTRQIAAKSDHDLEIMVTKVNKLFTILQDANS